VHKRDASLAPPRRHNRVGASSWAAKREQLRRSLRARLAAGGPSRGGGTCTKGTPASRRSTGITVWVPAAGLRSGSSCGAACERGWRRAGHRTVARAAHSRQGRAAIQAYAYRCQQLGCEAGAAGAPPASAAGGGRGIEGRQFQKMAPSLAPPRRHNRMGANSWAAKREQLRRRLRAQMLAAGQIGAALTENGRQPGAALQA